MGIVVRLIPADQPRRARPAVDRRTAGKPGNGADHPTTILVAEDDVLIRMAVADYLRECGYRVLEASNAAEAQAVMQAGEPVEIVFSDVNMPGTMNGFGLASWVRREFPDVKVILTSGAAGMAKQAEDACEEGPLLAKPYSYDLLLAHIRRLLAP